MLKTLYLDKNASSPPKLKKLRTESIQVRNIFPFADLLCHIHPYWELENGLRTVAYPQIFS